MAKLDPKTDYPLGTRRPELITTPSGVSLDELNLDQLKAGVIAGEDVRATPRTLRMQAEIAEAVNRHQLAENLRRAAELTRVPDDVILAIYTALRPGRSSVAGLEEWARTLEEDFDAPSVAAFVREALEVSIARGLIK
jgi:propanediol dehydratase small subunit